MIKKVILSAMLLAVTATGFTEEQVAKLYTDNDQSAPLSEVAFFLAADNDTDFQIVLTNGEALLGVKKVQFRLSGVGSVVARHDVKAFTVGESLHIDGCKAGDEIRLTDMSGHTLTHTTATTSGEQISVSSLLPGCYILRVAGNSVKFLKK